MFKVAIIVPVFKTFNELSNNEIEGLRNNFEILKLFPKYIISPISLCAHNESYFQKSRLDVERVEYFENSYFENIKGYNRLLTNSDFYNRFVNFDYVFICQLDVWIFYDRIQDYCSLNRSYIGGICFSGFDEKNNWNIEQILGAINGGASLRKVSDHIKLLRESSQWGGWLNLQEKISKYEGLNIIEAFRIVRNNKTKNVIKYLIDLGFNEDFVLYLASQYVNEFTVGDSKMEAIKLFSWDAAPWILFDNIRKLPMAAHAWFRTDYPYEGNSVFWAKYITVPNI